MPDFEVIVKEMGVRLTREQLLAIADFGMAKGGALELRIGGFGTVRIRDTSGREFLFRRDGFAEALD